MVNKKESFNLTDEKLKEKLSTKKGREQIESMGVGIYITLHLTEREIEGWLEWKYGEGDEITAIDLDLDWEITIWDIYLWTDKPIEEIYKRLRDDYWDYLDDLEEFTDSKEYIECLKDGDYDLREQALEIIEEE